jgi:hypothetical protein
MASASVRSTVMDSVWIGRKGSKVRDEERDDTTALRGLDLPPAWTSARSQSVHLERSKSNHPRRPFCLSLQKIANRCKPCNFESTDVHKENRLHKEPTDESTANPVNWDRRRIFIDHGIGSMKLINWNLRNGRVNRPNAWLSMSVLPETVLWIDFSLFWRMENLILIEVSLLTRCRKTKPVPCDQRLCYVLNIEETYFKDRHFAWLNYCAIRFSMGSGKVPTGPGRFPVSPAFVGRFFCGRHVFLTKWSARPSRLEGQWITWIRYIMR